MATTYAIPDGRVAMAATTYTGNGTARSIANTVNGVSMQPDFVWIKDRSVVRNHRLVDSVRGVGLELYSDLTNAQATDAIGLTAFNSDGFSLGTSAGYNQSGNSLIAWQWKAGGTAVSNTAGSITSSVSANTTAGFSVVTWAGNSTNAATIGHGLGVAPNLLITKSRTNASSWIVGIGNISGFGVNDYLVLQTTDAKSSTSTFYQAYGANTFTTGVSAANEMNKTGNNYVTYCFAAVAGYSAFGSYTGNGSTDGVFVYLGFRARYLLIKETGNANSWEVFDTSRNTANVETQRLFPNDSLAEATTNPSLDIVSNGFKLRVGNTGINRSGGTYIYAAFAENPFKYANAR